MGRRTAKKRNTTTTTGYVTGAHWRDVLAGKPVTVEEVTADKRRKGRKPGRCASCHRIEMIRPSEPPPTCRKCGGKVNPIV